MDEERQRLTACVVYIYTNIYIYTYIHIYIHIYINTYICICTSVCIPLYTYRHRACKKASSLGLVEPTGSFGGRLSPWNRNRQVPGPDLGHLNHSQNPLKGGEEGAEGVDCVSIFIRRCNRTLFLGLLKISSIARKLNPCCAESVTEHDEICVFALGPC